MLAMAIMMIFAAISVLLQQQYHQIAQAFPCVGHSAKEYCMGYHDGAIQANRDYKIGNNLDVDQHRCTASALYCNGYNRGYSDQADFLG